MAALAEGLQLSRQTVPSGEADGERQHEEHDYQLEEREAPRGYLTRSPTR